MGLLVSFLYLCLHVAVVLLVAAIIVWLCKWLGVSIDATVYKVGALVVALICIILVVKWLAGVVTL